MGLSVLPDLKTHLYKKSLQAALKRAAIFGLPCRIKKLDEQQIHGEREI